MLKFSETKELATTRRRIEWRTVTLCLCLLFLAGCRRDMQDQPKMKAFRQTSFFGDGLSARPPVEGTIPRGYLRSDTEFFTGKKKGSQATAAASQTPSGPQPTAATGTAVQAYPDDIDYFPIAVNADSLERGRSRFDIFCSACHGYTGKGDGMIVRRGYRRAASFQDERLRQAPVGHYFDAITNGWGAMPSYAPQIPVQDRWAIIAYIRALQLSQQNAQSTPSPTPGTPAASASPKPTTAGGQQR